MKFLLESRGLLLKADDTGKVGGDWIDAWITCLNACRVAGVVCRCVGLGVGVCVRFVEMDVGGDMAGVIIVVVVVVVVVCGSSVGGAKVGR